VERQLVRVRRQGVVLTSLLKTDSSRRTVPVGHVVIDAVTRHLAEHRPHPVLGLVFTNERGGPLQQSPFARTWGTARERAGAPGWATPHDLRHYYASLLIHRGASAKTVQRRLGHRSAKTTLDVWALWPDAEDATRAAVDDKLGPRLVSPSCHAL
jgi:integrase